MVDFLKVQEIVREAARFFLDREAIGQTKQKSDFDFVTAVDEAVQEFIKKELGKIYPEIQFIGEESDNSKVNWDGTAWILDPVDGTTNLIHGYRNSAISLALMEHRELLLGVIYNPFTDEMYYAQKGKGSFLNGKRIFVSQAVSMKESLIAAGTSADYKDEAGGTVLDYQGNDLIMEPMRDIVAGNAVIPGILTANYLK